MVRADLTMHSRIVSAIREGLVDKLQLKIKSFDPVATGLPETCQVGDIEDANVLVQNSLWQNVPLGRLGDYRQVDTLQDRSQWAPNQREQIKLIGQKFNELAEEIERLCV